MNRQSHIEWIDRLKGAGIVLVVLGHAVAGVFHLVDGSSQAVSQFFFKTIYSFHMPLFFFIAGMTFSTRGKPFGVFSRNKARRIIVPYFVFGIVSAVVFVVLQGHFADTVAAQATDAYYSGDAKTVSGWWVPFVSLLHAGGWPNGAGFVMNSVLWFLPCIFVVEIMGHWIERLIQCIEGLFPLQSSARLQSFTLAAVATVAFFAAGFIQIYVHCDLPWMVGKAVYFLPFFLAGKSLQTGLLLTGDKSMAWGGVGLLALVLLAVLCWTTPNEHCAYVDFGWYAFFSGMAFLGAIGMTLLVKNVKLPVMAACGSASMGIMLMHKFVVLAMELKCPPIVAMIKSGVVPRMAAGCVVVTIVSVAVCLAANWVILRVAPWAVGAKRK